MFSDQLFAAADEAEKMVTDMHQQAARTGHEVTVQHSSVDTGWLRRGNKLIINKEPPTTPDNRPLNATTGKYSPPPMPESKISRIKAGDLSIEYNLVPYAVYLENGTGPMYGPAELAVKSEMNQAVSINQGKKLGE